MKRTVLISLFVLLLFSACQKTVTSIDGLTEVDVTVLQNPSTKLELNGFQFSFSKGDAISLVVEGVNDAVLSNKGNANVNEFNGYFSKKAEDKSDCNWYVYYPASLRISDYGVISSTLPTTQNAPFDESSVVMFSNIITHDYSETSITPISFSMNQTFGIIKIEITNDDEKYKDEIIKKIQLQSSDVLTGNYSINIHDSSPKPIFDVYARNNAISVFSDNEIMGLNQSHTVYLVVNPTIISDAEITLTTDRHYFTLKSSSAINVIQGALTSFQPLSINNFDVEDIAGNMKNVACWGDSYTCNNLTSYADKLQDLLGVSWNVYNGGVSGDRVDEIAARQGSVSIVTQNAFTIPSSGSIKVDGLLRTIDDECNEGFFSIRRFGGAMANPCSIAGVECNVESTTTSATITRINSGEPIDIPSHTPILTYGSQVAKDVDLQIIYMGTNGCPVYYGEIEDANYYDNLVKYHKLMIDFNDRKSDYIILGYHTGLWNEYYWERFKNEFGQDRIIDLRHIVPMRGRELMIRTGAYPNLESIPDIELNRIDKGYWPYCFQASRTDVHPSPYGAKAIAYLVYERMQELGYLDL